MYLVDSSLIIAKFRENEEKHESANQFIAQLGEFVITDYILGEVATVLQIRSGKKAALEAIDFLISTKGVLHTRLTQEELEMTLDLFMKQEEDISFVDASILILSKERKYNMATLDKGLIESAKKRFPKKH